LILIGVTIRHGKKEGYGRRKEEDSEPLSVLPKEIRRSRATLTHATVPAKAIMKLTYKYRIYPTKPQVAFLDGQLREACEHFTTQPLRSALALGMHAANR